MAETLGIMIRRKPKQIFIIFFFLEHFCTMEAGQETSMALGILQSLQKSRGFHRHNNCSSKVY